MANKREFYGWRLVAALWLLDFLNMGFPLYGGAVISTYMLKQIAMSRSTFGAGFTLVNLFIGLPSTLVALSILRWGIKATFGAGSALILAGALGLSWFATRPWHYLLGFGVIIGTGISFGTLVPVSTTVTRWFSRYRGRAMAVPLGASGFAGFVGAPLLNHILAANGGNWRQAWQFIAAIAVLSGIVALVFVKESPQQLGQTVDGLPEELETVTSFSPNPLITKYDWTPAQAYRTTAYWMIVIGGIASQAPFFFFTAHGILHLRGAGIGASGAAWGMGLFTMAAIAGRLVGGWLMDKVAARFAFMSGFACYLLGSLLAMRVSAGALMIAFAAAILYGFGFGWTFLCLKTTTGNFYGPAAFPKLDGMVMLLTAVFAAPAGIIGGKLFDSYGSYQIAFELNMLVSALGIFALFFATMPQPGDGVSAAPAEATLQRFPAP